jgi:hypothetical protein
MAVKDAISRLRGRELDGRVLRVELSHKRPPTGGGRQ